MKIPVTLLCGWLGSGKTTLLNRLLKDNHGRRIAVIENEFGEQSIDSDLVLRRDGDIYEMNNGCLCCTVRDDLVTTLNRLIVQHDDIEHVIIETTGLARPEALIELFFMQAYLQLKFTLDGILTLVDAFHVQKHMEESEACRMQIAVADVLLVNKVDLCDDKEALATTLRERNPHASLQTCVYADADLTDFLKLNGLSAERAESLMELDHGHSHEHMHSQFIELNGLFDESKLQKFFQKNLFDYGNSLYRVKGILNVSGMLKPYIFQSVHKVFEGRESDLEPTETNRIVFIGRDLGTMCLEERLRDCLSF